MSKRKRIIQGTAFFLAIVLAWLIAFSGSVFADDSYTDEYGNYVEWWNYRNTATNNAVTDRPTPTNDQEAWGKWAVKYGSGWEGSPTPPVIVNDKLYIGVNDQILEIDKETGQVLRESEQLPGNVGYAIQSPLYADGKLFVGIINGRIAAVNLSDLSLAWVTDNSNIIKGQTLSPLSYVNINGTGYVYTGTWSQDGGDMICASTDDSDVNYRIKKLTWHFNPDKEDKENLTANESVALGYYGTGAYVTEQYLAVGADNGATLGGADNEKTAFYTLNPLSGEIIDVVYGIKGPVRSTTVYANGHLYFSTKDAKLYKIPVTEDGLLGEPSYIDMSEYGGESTASTPIVYGGRIYLGVQGKGGQYNADGGHGFFVAEDDEILSQESFVYSIPVPGYPQAGALLSDYHVDEDFDGDGAADGRVYLFFTYNTPPGGIFYTYDAPGQTEPAKLSIDEARIFVPASEQQEHCISPIVVDEDGVLYYKNDSCHLFAVESNPASLSNLEVFNEDGDPLPLNEDFRPKMAEYKITAETSASSISLRLTLGEGVSATIDGNDYTGDQMTVDLPENLSEIEIITSKNGRSRTYMLTVVKASMDCDLSSLGSAINNMAPSETNQNTRRITPQFSKDITEYTFNWFSTGTGSTSGVIDPVKITQMNLFLKTSSSMAAVQVFPGENVDQPSNSLNPDGSIKRYAVSNNIYDSRYPVYSADVTRDSSARIVVTAEDGFTTKEYLVTFNRRVYVTEVSLNQETAEMKKGDTLTLTARVFPGNATSKVLTWSSSDEAVATVDETGIVTAVGPGTATITAASEDGPAAACAVTVPMEWKEGWNQVDSNWYYYENGNIVKSWKQVSGTWYFMDPETGVMQTGWVKDGNTWYYMKPSGAMATGWVKDGNTWYYMKSSGAMQTGWLKDGSAWYYMKSSGAMAANEWCEGYWLNANGTWTYPYKGSWNKNSTGWWFGDTSGWYASNSTQKIDNKNYTFNASGYWME